MIDDKLLARLEKLSNLKIEDSKREEFKNQLEEIVGFVENLNELELDGLKSSFSMQDIGTTLREDNVNKSDVIKSILKNAPSVSDNMFEVPKILG
ncbi:MAG: Unknown protein [uncultured Campylobacterales bacterium]|uniref:Aspartyl/glutamyl-tRNA(Asn/Gln) amidotransferase subunit C n=2 Tax=uncultured Campylobacterales bacterium TaxID=352960 RepID=A0A6S6S9D4_9BACT|nr:MAG: Unknown protein [uncultured Campylobacterales bacterium]